MNTEKKCPGCFELLGTCTEPEACAEIIKLSAQLQEIQASGIRLGAELTKPVLTRFTEEGFCSLCKSLPQNCTPECDDAFAQLQEYEERSNTDLQESADKMSRLIGDFGEKIQHEHIMKPGDTKTRLAALRELLKKSEEKKQQARN